MIKDYSSNHLSKNSLSTIGLIDRIISDLSKGKVAGVDGITAEHIQHSHPIIELIVTKPFNLMLLHKYVPNEFGRGLAISIPKYDSVKKSVMYNDFLGTTISLVLSKVFEAGVLKNFDKYFQTSDHQFGFKKNSSCTHAIYSVRQTINHYVNNGSTVNICAMDLSKAFDKVNHHCLLLKLMERRVPLHVIDLLERWLSKSFIAVKWGTFYSSPVKLKAGVRQGGVLSPVLFAIYINDMIVKIINSKYGCHMDGFCASIFVYADDIVLLTSSVSEMQRLVDLCVDELSKTDMLLNSDKTVCLRVGSRFMSKCVSITIDGNMLRWISELRYLGVFIVSSKEF